MKIEFNLEVLSEELPQHDPVVGDLLAALRLIDRAMRRPKP
jgi:hypothetical protein